MQNKSVLGAWGEAAAAEYLRKKGYEVLAMNYRCRYGEIDLIVHNKKFLVFVEVKLRASDAFASAREFVDFHKQRRLQTSAELWLSTHETLLQPRFDVLEIYAENGIHTKTPQIHHIENAF